MCYKEGLQLFLEVVQAITEKEKKAKYCAKASEYLDRSEKVQEIVTREKELGRYQEHYKIEANSEVKTNFRISVRTCLDNLSSEPRVMVCKNCLAGSLTHR